LFALTSQRASPAPIVRGGDSNAGECPLDSESKIGSHCAGLAVRGRARLPGMAGCGTQGISGGPRKVHCAGPVWLKVARACFQERSRECVCDGVNGPWGPDR